MLNLGHGAKVIKTPLPTTTPQPSIINSSNGKSAATPVIVMQTKPDAPVTGRPPVTPWCAWKSVVCVE
jgi:hypothetical protein